MGLCYREGSEASGAAGLCYRAVFPGEGQRGDPFSVFAGMDLSRSCMCQEELLAEGVLERGSCHPMWYLTACCRVSWVGFRCRGCF